MTLSSLIARVEGLSGPDREVDALVWLSQPEQADCELVAYSDVSKPWRDFGVTDVVNPDSYISGIVFRRDGRPQAFSASWPRYTGSYDAVMTLVQDDWWFNCSGPMSPKAYGYSREDMRSPRAGVEMIGEPYSAGGAGKTLILAILLACLRARDRISTGGE